MVDSVFYVRGRVCVYLCEWVGCDSVELPTHRPPPPRPSVRQEFRPSHERAVPGVPDRTGVSSPSTSRVRAPLPNTRRRAAASTCRRTAPRSRPPSRCPGYVPAAAAATATAGPSFDKGAGYRGPEDFEDMEISTIRRVIADRLLESKTTVRGQGRPSITVD